MQLKFNKELIVSILLLIFALVFVYFFTSIVVYMIIASVLALLAKPLKNILLKAKIKQWSVSNVLATFISLFVLISIFVTVFVILIPAIVDQTSALASLDYNAISQNINQLFINSEVLLKDYGVLKPEESLAMIIQSYLTTLVSDIQVNQMASDAFSALGSIFIGVFSVLFIGFFFLRDENLFQNIILLFVPESRRIKTTHAFLKIKQLFSRYFIGLLTEVGAMMILESIGGLILGLPNAILIGFIGGLLNIIPYIGPMIGTLIAVILVVVSNINSGIDTTLLLVYGIMAVFIIANLIDNFLLQPYIYSNSVKAHPLEIFIVIIVGGTIYGPLGMIIAIPAYTIIRVLAKEFLGELDFVQKVTKFL
jgi:predicted PurR-regulated permease PerM